MTLILAEEERMQNLFRSLRAIKAKEGMDDAVYGLLILAGIIFVMLILSLIIDLRNRRRGYSNPRSLFWNLCRAHKLKLSDRWLLWRMARLQKFTDPARLFLEPQWYSRSRVPAELRQYETRLKGIRNKLFSELKGKMALCEDDHSVSAHPVPLKGAALPVSQNAPKLDVSPWPTSVFAQPLPTTTSSSDNAPA
jgi:hypothetical protein